MFCYIAQCIHSSEMFLMKIMNGYTAWFGGKTFSVILNYKYIYCSYLQSCFVNDATF